MRSGIQAIEPTSIRRITSGQVVIDLQTAVKELVENSLDAGATVLEVRFKNYGLTSIEVVDNGTGIEEADWDAIALNHHTSKLTTLDDLDTVQTFGFRGEALSSLCALCESVSVSTTTKPPMGVILELEASGKVKSKGKVARQRGTTIVLSKLFAPLPVRRKELERHVKREFGKAVALLQAYALGPCAQNGVRMTVSNQPDKGQKSVQLRTPGTPSLRAAATALWGPRALDNVVDLDISFLVERDKHSLKRLSTQPQTPIRASLRGLISAFAPGSGRAGADRQFFYVNGRPCLLPKIQKTLTEVYRTFNAPGTQAPMVVADLILPTNAYDVNVSPDKRTIFVHHEAGLMQGLKVCFSPFLLNQIAFFFWPLFPTSFLRFSC
ncbi:histidine kinase-like ATPase [Mycena amicta]|nr:histidine kinase-like ATPase [Mycena amicta]